MNKNGNLILTSLMESEREVKEVSSTPDGYIEVKLSTKGKVGAPSVVHVRNFKVSEIISLSLSSNADLPIRLIDILNDMILEDTDVFTWHEKEIEEIIKSINISDTDNISAARAIESILLTADIKGQKEITTEFTKLLSQTKTAYSEYICKSLNY